MELIEDDISNEDEEYEKSLNDLNIITIFISAWCWQIISIIFLTASIIMFAMPRTLITSSFYVAMFLIFVFGQYQALKRRKEIQ